MKETQAIIKNAKIVRTTLGREEHGIMTLTLWVEFEDRGCYIGGMNLGGIDRDSGKYTFAPKGLAGISEICETVGVKTWEDLPGMYIRVKDNDWNAPIEEFGNLTKDKWFNIREFFKGGTNVAIEP